MPELPEVETIRRQMERELIGKKIIGVEVRFGKRLNLPAKKFIEVVRGAKFVSFGRRAKLLLLNLSNRSTIVAHLKMTGKFVLKPHGTPPGKHAHIVFALNDGRDLWFDDVRKFGFLKLLPTEKVEAMLEQFGPEPLETKFTNEVFASCLKKRPKKLVKPLLMEPTCIAGVGNIYADEALWLAKIRPTRRVVTLTKQEIEKLHNGIITSLRESLKHRGASAENYRDLYDTEGTSMDFLHAYAQEKCSRCKGAIKKIKIGSRSAHYCPVCQS